MRKDNDAAVNHGLAELSQLPAHCVPATHTMCSMTEQHPHRRASDAAASHVVAEEAAVPLAAAAAAAMALHTGLCCFQLCVWQALLVLQVPGAAHICCCCPGSVCILPFTADQHVLGFASAGSAVMTIECLRDPRESFCNSTVPGCHESMATALEPSLLVAQHHCYHK